MEINVSRCGRTQGICTERAEIFMVHLHKNFGAGRLRLGSVTVNKPTRNPQCIISSVAAAIDAVNLTSHQKTRDLSRSSRP